MPFVHRFSSRFTSRPAGFIVGLVGVLLLAPGCSMIEKSNQYDLLQLENSNLRRRLAQLEANKDSEISDLERAKRSLEDRLRGEIDDTSAKLEMTDRGLVITFLAEVFFQSGKAELMTSAESSLTSVAEVLEREIPSSSVAIEGHTDNVPITHSGWDSNWELSAARALAVLHYLIDQGNINPERLSVAGYGEFQPVASNETAEGRQQNRRVEIVVLPAPGENVSKVSQP